MGESLALLAGIRADNLKGVERTKTEEYVECLIHSSGSVLKVLIINNEYSFISYFDYILCVTSRTSNT